MSLFVYRQVGNRYALGNLRDGTLKTVTGSDIANLIDRGYLINGVTVNGNQYWVSTARLADYPFRCSCGASSVVVRWQDVALCTMTGREVFVAADVVVSIKNGAPMYNIRPIVEIAAKKLNCRESCILLSTINRRVPSQTILVENGITTSCLGAMCNSCGSAWLPNAFVPQR